MLKCHRALSEVPTTKAIAGVRVGLVGDRFIVNPTTKEMEESELDLVLAGTDSAILMIEVSSFIMVERKSFHRVLSFSFIWTRRNFINNVIVLH